MQSQPVTTELVIARRTALGSDGLVIVYAMHCARTNVCQKRIICTSATLNASSMQPAAAVPSPSPAARPVGAPWRRSLVSPPSRKPDLHERDRPQCDGTHPRAHASLRRETSRRGRRITRRAREPCLAREHDYRCAMIERHGCLSAVRRAPREVLPRAHRKNQSSSIPRRTVAAAAH